VFDVLERRSLPRRSLNPQPSTLNILNCKTHCPKLPGGVISLRPEKPKRPENHFTQLRLLSVTKNSCKLAVKAEIDYIFKL